MMSALAKVVGIKSEGGGNTSELISVSNSNQVNVLGEPVASGVVYSQASTLSLVDEEYTENEPSHVYEGKKGIDTITVKVTDGDNWYIYTYEGNDIITIKGGNGHYINGGPGNDRFTLEGIVANGYYVIDQSDGGASDRDTLYLSKYSSYDFKVETDGSDLLLKHIALDATIRIVNWINRPLSYINFRECRISTKQIAYANGTSQYTLKMKGSFVFQGSNTVSASNSTISNGDAQATTGITGNNNTIYATGGVVTLASGNNNNLIGDADGSRIIINDGTNNTVLGEAAQTIVVVNGGSNGTIELGSSSAAQSITLNSGAGNNYIISSLASDNTIELLGGEGHVISCGSHDDTIIVNNEAAANYTISTGAGNDRVELLSGHVSTLNMGTGNKSIVLAGGTVGTINCEGTLQYYLQGVSMTLDESTDGVPIILGGNNTLYLNGFNTEIFSGAAGNDTFVMNSGNINQLVGNEGDDTFVLNGNSNARLVGGLGNDTYVLNNLVENASYVIDQNVTGSKDTGEDILDLTNYSSGGFMLSKDEDGNIVLTHKNLGANITIDGSKDNALAEVRFQDKMLDAATIEKLLYGSAGISQAEVIKNFMDCLNESSNYGSGNNGAFSEAVVNCSNGLYSSAQDLIDSFKYACINYGGTTTSTEKAFLKEYCGIDLDNTDTGAITGFDAGGPEVKTKDSVVAEPEGMTLENIVYDGSNKVTATGFWSGTTKEYSYVTIYDNGEPLIIYWDEAQLQEVVDKGLVSDISIMQETVAAVINGMAGSSLDLIYDSYGMSLATGNSQLQSVNGTKAIELCLDYASPTVKASYSTTSSYSWVASTASRVYNGWYISGYEDMIGAKEVLTINMYYYSEGLEDISGKPDSENITNMYLDRVIAHELVHGAMAANISPNSYLPSFLKEGLAELVHGVDDERRYELLTIANKNGKIYSSSGSYTQEQYLDKIFNLSSSSYLLSSYSYAAGYALMRYLAKTVSDNSKDTAAQGGVDLALSDAIINMNQEELVLGDLVNVTSTTYIDYTDINDLKLSGNI